MPRFQQLNRAGKYRLIRTRQVSPHSSSSETALEEQERPENETVSGGKKNRLLFLKGRCADAPVIDRPYPHAFRMAQPALLPGGLQEGDTRAQQAITLPWGQMADRGSRDPSSEHTDSTLATKHKGRVSWLQGLLQATRGSVAGRRDKDQGQTSGNHASGFGTGHCKGSPRGHFGQGCSGQHGHSLWAGECCQQQGLADSEGSRHRLRPWTVVTAHTQCLARRGINALHSPSGRGAGLGHGDCG